MAADPDAPDDLVIEETEPEPKTSASRAQAGQGRTERPRPSADRTRAWLRRRIAYMVQWALEWNDLRRMAGPLHFKDPPHRAIKVSTGVGKSELLRQEIARYVIAAKRRGLPHRVLIPLPTHRLADEANRRMPEGVTTLIWQGRDSIHLGTAEPMCRNPEAVKAALAIGADIQEAACRHHDACCPFYEGCHYQTMRAAARNADVVFVAHEILFSVPAALGKNFGLVVIDESFWQDGITGTKLAVDRLHHELNDFPVHYQGNRLVLQTMHLSELINRLQDAFGNMPDGYVQRAPLLKAGLLPATANADSSCKVARDLEWRRKVETTLRPDASDDDRKQAVNKFGFIGQLPRRAAMWRALDDLINSSDDATGRLILETETTEAGTVRWLLVRGHKKISEKLIDLPLIHADASMNFGLVKHYLPGLRRTIDIAVDAPHMRVTQVIGKKLYVGISSLRPLPPGKRSDDEEARVGRKRQRLVDMVQHLTQGRRGLVITYKDVESAFRAIAGVEVAHFGAIEGVDRWKDVDVLVIIGRPLPAPKDIERIAAAVTGQPVIAGDMIKQNREIRPGHVLECKVYDVPDVEMIRAAVTEAAIDQGVGRARGVNRTAANPVEVYLVLGDTVVPGLDVDEVVDIADIEPGAVDKMFERGLMPQFPADAAKLFPDLFPTHASAKMAYHRAGLRVELGPAGLISVTSSYKNISIRRCYRPPCVDLLIQSAGRGQQPRFCMADLDKVPDPRAVLEAVLGPLKRFEVL